MSLVVSTLVVALLAAFGLARHFRGDLARLRYLRAAANEPDLAIGHLSLRWRNLVQDARLLRITLEGVLQGCSEEMIVISQELRARMTQAHFDTMGWITEYLRVIEAEPVEAMHLRQRVDLLSALSARWNAIEAAGPLRVGPLRDSLAQAVDVLRFFEQESVFLSTPYR